MKNVQLDLYVARTAVSIGLSFRRRGKKSSPIRFISKFSFWQNYPNAWCHKKEVRVRYLQWEVRRRSTA